MTSVKTTLPALRPFDEIFYGKSDNTDKAIMIPLERLHAFRNHPYKVIDDADMQDMANSIRQYGVMVPAIVRATENGEYEIIAGHRRKRACEIAGRTAMPAIVRVMDDDEAVIAMTDSNLQRSHILPSEWANALKMKIEAIRHQGMRTTQISTLPQVGAKRSSDIVAADAGMGRENVRRYIRLTYLVKPLIDMVDAGSLAFGSAVEISYLSEAEQTFVLNAMAKYLTVPSLAQAKILKAESATQKLDERRVDEILATEKKDTNALKIPGQVIMKYFGNKYTPVQIEKIIIELLDAWRAKK